MQDSLDTLQTHMQTHQSHKKRVSSVAAEVVGPASTMQSISKDFFPWPKTFLI